jgi:hypothetical protein
MIQVYINTTLTMIIQYNYETFMDLGGCLDVDCIILQAVENRVQTLDTEKEKRDSYRTSCCEEM